MLNKYLILIIALTFLSACSGGGGGSGPTPPPPPVNTAPVANAGTDQTVETGVLVTLNASASSDANGDTLTYAWSISSAPAGSTSALSSASAVNATFTPDIAGTYVAQLIVNDGTVSSAANTVTITATAPNMAPIANAGVDQTVITGATVDLDGNASSDPEGDNLSYTWSIANAPSNSTAVLSDAQVVSPSLVVNVDGVYTLELVVNDGELSSAVDSMTITASTPNTAPVANAGVDQNITTASLVTLDASASNDADGDTITYTWSLSTVPQNSSAVLSDANAVSPTFTADVDGTYTAQLIVNDGTVDSQADLVDVVAATANSAPVANAGVDANVETGSVVTLDASASSDSNGDMITYLWSLSSVPAGSNAVLSSTTSAMPSFTADLDGTYVASLVVSDGSLSSQADTVSVSATTTNVAPVASAGADQNVTVLSVVSLNGSASSDAK